MSTTAANFEASADEATDLKFNGPAKLTFSVSPAGTSVTVGIVALGASFTATTLTVTTAASDDRSPSDALTVKVASPFSLAARA